MSNPLDEININDLRKRGVDENSLLHITFHNVLSKKDSTFYKATQLFEEACRGPKGNNYSPKAPIMLRQRNISQDWNALIDQVEYINSRYTLNECDSSKLLELFRELNFKNICDDQTTQIIYDMVIKTCQLSH